MVWPAATRPLPDPATAVRRALSTPLRAVPLRTLARGTARVAVAVPDASRKVPLDVIVPAIVDDLQAAGVPTTSVDVLVGCGMHRDLPPAEIAALLGPVADRVGIGAVQGSVGPHTDLGTTAAGCPVQIDRRVADADLVVAVGLVEPHLYAGYSGGVKAVAIGCAGEPTIAWTHAPAFISRPGVELLRLADNPFQECLRDISARTPLGWAVDVVMDSDGRLVDVVAGGPVAVQEQLSRRHAATWRRESEATYDAILAGIPAPKDANLYQATRAATYIGLADRPALRDGGLIVLCAGLADGAGDGPGEQNFCDLLRAYPPRDLLRRALDTPLGPGGQRAYVVARVLDRCRIGVVGGRPPEGLGIERFADLEEARAHIASPEGRPPRVLVVADALTTIVRECG